MRHSLEPKHGVYIKGYVFLSFANKYGKKKKNDKCRHESRQKDS